MGETVEQKQPNKKNTVWIILTVLLGIIALLVIAFFAVDIYLSVNYFVVEVSGNSMRETLNDGDYLYAEREFEVHRGDVVILSVENHRTGTFFGESTQFIIKRTIALEGDTIRIEEKLVPYLDKDGNPLNLQGNPIDEEKGEKPIWKVVNEVSVMYAGTTEYQVLQEDYVNTGTPVFIIDSSVWEEKAAAEWTVGEGEIFFMGDNRGDSYDSRRVGCFNLTDVVGVVPQWAVNRKEFSTKWEHFRAIIRGQEPLPSKDN